MMACEPSETELVAALVAAAVMGDRGALQQLLCHSCPDLSRYIRTQCPAVLKGQVELDDLLQDTLFAAVRDFRQFRGRTSFEFRAWLESIARHRLQNAVKYATAFKRRGLPRGVGPVDPSPSSMSNLLASVVDSGDTPSRGCSRQEEIHAIHVGLAHLPGDQRRAVMLRYLDGNTTQEAAQAMERSPGAIRGLVDRAKVSLKQVLGKSSRWFGGK